MGEDFFVRININGIKHIIDVLNGPISNEKLMKLIRSKPMRKFIEHERAMNKNVDKYTLMEEIIKLKTYKDYKDKFNFYILNANLSNLSREIEYIKLYEEQIIKNALEKVYLILPRSLNIRSKIYLYGGGIDGAFTLNRREIYINYIKYLANKDELIKVISHELFHCRDISVKIKLKDYIRFNMKDRYLYELLGKIFEEGIALLIQHGTILKKDDPANSITRAKLSFIDMEFTKLNSLLREIRDGVKYVNIKSIDYYALGYYIVSFLYDYYKRDILLPWILEFDYKPLIKSYIMAVRELESKERFTKDVENWLMTI